MWDSLLTTLEVLRRPKVALLIQLGEIEGEGFLSFSNSHATCQLCCPGPNVPPAPPGRDFQKHVILIAASNPCRVASPVPSPPVSMQSHSNNGDLIEHWWLADADQVAQVFSPVRFLFVFVQSACLSKAYLSFCYIPDCMWRQQGKQKSLLLALIVQSSSICGLGNGFPSTLWAPISLPVSCENWKFDKKDCSKFLAQLVGRQTGSVNVLTCNLACPVVDFVLRGCGLQCFVSLSVVAPRQLPPLRNVFAQVLLSQRT